MVKTSDNEYQSVGELLKDAREKRKLKISTVSAKIRIRVAYLEAMEEGRFSDLPGPAYASGFVRSYASFLGLNPNEVYDRYKEETSADGVRNTLVVHELEDDEVSVPKRKEILIGIIALIVICSAWYVVSTVDYDSADVDTAEEVEVVEDNSIIVNEDVPVEAGADVAVETKTPVEAIKEDRPVVEEEAKVESVEAKEVNAEVEANVVEGNTIENKVEPAENNEEQNAVKKAENIPETRVKLVANSQTWIQVSQDTKVLASRILEAGDEYAVPDEEGILLRTGNAGGLDIFVDGKQVEPVGPKGAVRSGVLLDAEALLLR